MPPAILVNKGVAAIKPSHYGCPMVSPEGSQGGGRICPPSSSQPLQPPPVVHSEGTQDGKVPDTSPRQLRCRSKEWFQWAQTSHLPIHRKMLNSLTWDIWFSWINCNLLMFLLPGLCCKNSCISWLSPCLFTAASQSYLRCCVLGLSPQFCLPNKT